jgi:DNA-binding winged helix-turn-helix (wHTH) protein
MIELAHNEHLTPAAADLADERHLTVRRASAPPVTTNPGASPAPPADPVLVVDDKHPGAITLEGASVKLQEKQYRLIRTLAARPGECVPYDTIYTAVWGDVVVEPNQMHFQKRKLLDRIARIAPHHDKLITTVPKRGFVLNLEPEAVMLEPRDASAAA